MPILETEEGSIGQSAAINYYVATECGLMGKTPFQVLLVQSIMMTVLMLQLAGGPNLGDPGALEGDAYCLWQAYSLWCGAYC